MTAKITVCNGPVCKSLGSIDLLKAARRLSERKSGTIDFDVQNCFSRCESDESLCPCVKINEEYITNATPAKIRQKLAEL